MLCALTACRDQRILRFGVAPERTNYYLVLSSEAPKFVMVSDIKKIGTGMPLFAKLLFGRYGSNFGRLIGYFR